MTELHDDKGLWPSAIGHLTVLSLTVYYRPIREAGRTRTVFREVSPSEPLDWPPPRRSCSSNFSFSAWVVRNCSRRVLSWSI